MIHPVPQAVSFEEPMALGFSHVILIDMAYWGSVTDVTYLV